jgi:hypothetical protein
MSWVPLTPHRGVVWSQRRWPWEPWPPSLGDESGHMHVTAPITSNHGRERAVVAGTMTTAL